MNKNIAKLKELAIQGPMIAAIGFTTIALLSYGYYDIKPVVTYFECTAVWQTPANFVYQSILNTTVGPFFAGSNQLCFNTYGPYFNNYSVFIWTSVFSYLAFFALLATEILLIIVYFKMNYEKLLAIKAFITKKHKDTNSKIINAKNNCSSMWS